jgi:cardiolipin synthase (CMP-forming)
VKLQHIPNLLSLFRMLLVIPVVVAMSRGQFHAAMLLVAIAASTDLLDGWLARRFGWRTRLGALLDPAADKLLVFSVYIVFWYLALLPPVLIVVVLVRDLMILIGALVIHLRTGAFDAAPSGPSKLNTTFQSVLAIAVLMQAAWGIPSEPVIHWLGALTLVTTVVSGIHYVLERERHGFRVRRRAG